MFDIAQVRKGDTVRITVEGAYVGRYYGKGNRVNVQLAVADDKPDVEVSWEEDNVEPQIEILWSEPKTGDIADIWVPDANEARRAIYIDASYASAHWFDVQGNKWFNISRENITMLLRADSDTPESGA